MTFKGLRDGAFLAGLVLLWLDMMASLPPSLFTVLLVTVPTVARIVEATRGRGEKA